MTTPKLLTHRQFLVLDALAQRAQGSGYTVQTRDLDGRVLQGLARRGLVQVERIDAGGRKVSITSVGEAALQQHIETSDDYDVRMRRTTKERDAMTNDPQVTQFVQAVRRKLARTKTAAAQSKPPLLVVCPELRLFRRCASAEESAQTADRLAQVHRGVAWWVSTPNDTVVYEVRGTPNDEAVGQPEENQEMKNQRTALRPPREGYDPNQVWLVLIEADRPGMLPSPEQMVGPHEAPFLDFEIQAADMLEPTLMEITGVVTDVLRDHDQSYADSSIELDIMDHIHYKLADMGVPDEHLKDIHVSVTPYTKQNPRGATAASTTGRLAATNQESTIMTRNRTNRPSRTRRRRMANRVERARSRTADKRRVARRQDRLQDRETDRLNRRVASLQRLLRKAERELRMEEREASRTARPTARRPRPRPSQTVRERQARVREIRARLERENGRAEPRRRPARKTAAPRRPIGRRAPRRAPEKREAAPQRREAAPKVIRTKSGKVLVRVD